MVSIYKPGTISPKVLAEGIGMIVSSFPKLSAGWYEVLKAMLVEEQFNDVRFFDAVKNLIKTSVYPEPTIANIISFDKTTKTMVLNQ